MNQFLQIFLFPFAKKIFIVVLAIHVLFFHYLKYYKKNYICILQLYIYIYIISKFINTEFVFLTYNKFGGKEF